ncbi:hypothetical protein, partial [uncultured Bacteroides sp.]|uniref:hypothetical protein n=1 Tax=uncultured Bacteroides sp. TaxID=162156 RepID=UPI0026307272
HTVFPRIFMQCFLTVPEIFSYPSLHLFDRALMIKTNKKGLFFVQTCAMRIFFCIFVARIISAGDWQFRKEQTWGSLKSIE